MTYIQNTCTVFQALSYYLPTIQTCGY